MKTFTLTSLLLLSPALSYALPVGNPSEASLLCDGIFCPGRGPSCPTLHIWDDFSYRAGFSCDYVFNRHLRVHNHDNEENRKELDHSSLFTNAGYIDVNVWNGFDFFATLGASSLNLEGNLTTFGPLSSPTATGRLEIETETDFSWSVGVCGTVWECKGVTLGMEGQFFTTNPKVRRLTAQKLSSLYPTATTPYLSARYTEWQVGVGVSWRIHLFVPYIAMKWSSSELLWKNNLAPIDFTDFSVVLNDFRSKKHLGFAAGVSLIDCFKAAVTVEGRFGDEKALYVNGQFRF